MSGRASDHRRGGLRSIETETLTRTRRQVQEADPAWVLGPEDRSSIEAEIPNDIEVESNKPRPIQKYAAGIL